MTSPTGKWLKEVVAQYRYDPEEHDELAFEEGDKLRVLQVQDDGWWFGYRVDSPITRGLFPSNYVQESPKVSSPPPIASYKAMAMTGFDQEDNNSGESGIEGENDGDAWQQSASTPRGALAIVRELRKNAGNKSPQSRGGSPSVMTLKERERRYFDDPADNCDDGTSNDLAEDADDNDEYRYGLRRHVRQRSQPRFRPLSTGSIEEETGDPNDDEEDENNYQVVQRKHVCEPNEQDTLYDDNPSTTQRDGYVSLGHDSWNEESENDRYVIESIDRGSFSVAADRRDQMSAVISDYQRRKEQNTAASVIARCFRQHCEYQFHQQKEQKRQRRRQQELNRRRWAYQVIGEALTRIIQRKRRLELLEKQKRAADTLRGSILRRRQQRQRKMKAAVIRIQRWYRQRLVYRRWKSRVEQERQALRAARIKQQELLKQQRRQQAQQQQKQSSKQVQDPRRPRDSQIKESPVSTKAIVSPSPSSASSPSHSPSPPKDRPRKTVMKREAVDLISGLVKQQLDATLHERDMKMEELQRMIATLQDVVQKQNVMLTASNNQLTELRREREEAAKSQCQSSHLPILHVQNSSRTQPHTKTVSPSRSPKKEAAFPRLAPTKPGATGIPTRSLQPTGLRAPRPIAFPTKLPALVSGRGESPPRQMKQ